MSAKIRDLDKGAKAFMKEMAGLSTAHVRVGVQGERAQEAHRDSNATVGEIATFHEFGTSSIPERSFIRATIDQGHDEVKSLQRRVAALVGKGKMTAETGLELLGQKVQAMIQARIRSNIPPALKPRTIQRKGSSVALIDTGQLVQSITYRTVPAKGDHDEGNE